MRNAAGLIGRVVIATALIAGCGNAENSGTKQLDTLHKESFEAIVGIWPLTVDEATPVCGTKNAKSLGVEVAGVTYALNGTGETWEHWRDLHEIWAPDPTIPGAYLNEDDLLDFVQRRC